MPPTPPVHTVHDAIALILSGVMPLETEIVALSQALDRVLVRDAVSPVSLPPWDNASMDGYAVRAEDVAGVSESTPILLPVRGTVAAGGQAADALDPGTAVRIMTGAPIPVGADTVIRVEDTDRGTGHVSVRNARDAGRNVRPLGEDLRAGQVALVAGTVVGPAQQGVLASIGAATLAVHRLPRVAVMSSGDELVDLDRFDEVLAGRRIVSSNGYSLRAAALQCGALIEDLGIVRDDPRLLAEAFERAMASDLILTSGGVSAGAFDHTRSVVRQLGGDIQIHRIRMRPGAPLAFGVIRGVPWLGLPGNPASALVTFELFARPLIRKLRGEHLLYPIPIAAVLDDEITLAAPLTHFLRAILAADEGGRLHATLTGPQGSGLLTSMARANGLVVVHAERTVVRKGEAVRALLLGGSALLSASFSL